MGIDLLWVTSCCGQALTQSGRYYRPSTTDDLILDPLSPAELYKYAGTCRAAHNVVNSYIRRHFSLHKLLGRYFSDSEILEFRMLQFNTGMVISGSAALQFFNRIVYDESDLDLYVEHRYRKSIAVWLQHIGYEYAPHAKSTVKTLDQALSSAGPESTQIDIKITEGLATEFYDALLVLTFEKHRPYRKVQVITSILTPISKVLRFHSSKLLNDIILKIGRSDTLAACVMNVITHNKAYCLFPRGTFGKHRRSLEVYPYRSSSDTTRATQALEKYESRGWTIIPTAAREDFEGPNAAFPHGLRRVGDAKCWTIPISPYINLPDGCIESNSWVTRYDQSMNVTMRFYGMYSHNLLRAGYILPEDGRLVDWIREIMSGPISEFTLKLDR